MVSCKWGRETRPCAPVVSPAFLAGVLEVFPTKGASIDETGKTELWLAGNGRVVAVAAMALLTA